MIIASKLALFSEHDCYLKACDPTPANCTALLCYWYSCYQWCESYCRAGSGCPVTAILAKLISGTFLMKMWGWKIQLIMSVHPQTPPSVWRGGYHSPHIQVTLPCYILTIQTSKLAKRINPSSLLCGMWFSSNSKQGKLLINDFKLLCCFQHSLIMIRPIQCCCWCLTMASSHTVPAWGTPRHWLSGVITSLCLDTVWASISVWHLLLPVQLPGSHWAMICVIRHLAMTVSDVCLKLGCFQSERERERERVDS